MDQKVTGTVISAAKQWWLKVNTKPVRRHSFDGAIFPYIIRVEYVVGNQTYIKRKWVGAGKPVPAVGSLVEVLYCADKPGRAKIL